jgi:hypothetical protein
MISMFMHFMVAVVMLAVFILAACAIGVFVSTNLHKGEMEHLQEFLALVSLTLIFLFLAFELASINEKNLHKWGTEKDKAWVAAKCPMYETNCSTRVGSTTCNARAEVVGRNIVRNQYVEAYPTC